MDGNMYRKLMTPLAGVAVVAALGIPAASAQAATAHPATAHPATAAPAGTGPACNSTSEDSIVDKGSGYHADLTSAGILDFAESGSGHPFCWVRFFLSDVCGVVSV